MMETLERMRGKPSSQYTFVECIIHVLICVGVWITAFSCLLFFLIATTCDNAMSNWFLKGSALCFVGFVVSVAARMYTNKGELL